jgi:hypothetical protein
MSSQAQIAANQANAQLSTGATTAEGKAKSSMNALKTGLTGHTVLLPTDDAALYEAKLLQHLEGMKPVGEKETALVQALTDTEWRLARIPGLEYGIYALARIEFAHKFDDQPEEHRSVLIHSYTYLAYQRQFNNLSIQEARLNRQLLKIINELHGLQQRREQQEQAKLTLAARQYLAANQAKKPFNHKEFGFDFSMDQIDRHARLIEQREKALGAA